MGYCALPNVSVVVMRGHLLGVALFALCASACGDEAASPPRGESAGGHSGAVSDATQGGAQATGGAPAMPLGGAAGGGASGASGGVEPGNVGGAGNAGTSSTSGGASAASGGMPSLGGAHSAGSAGMAGNVTAGGNGAAGGGGNVAGVAGAADASGGTAGMAGASGKCSSAGGDSLRDTYANCFPIGAAVDAESYMTHGALLRKHFNSITVENEMKFQSLQPTEGQFTYDAADRIVNFASQNDMRVRGHTLVWHSQNPSWLFDNASKETLLTRMRTHISNVVRHYKGKVYAWDVVNEAVMEDGSYRTGDLADDQKSRWYEIIGESYIAEAFKAAHEADPDAKLFYNDFYDYIPAKHTGIYNMLKRLLEQGVPVHGVGMQCHLNIEPSTIPTNQGYHQSVENLEAAIELYSSLGLEVHVTELDLSLYIPGVMYDESTFYTPATFTVALQIKQAERYRAFFELFRKHADVITNVTFWGIADDNTWLSEFRSGRQDFPLLFDTAHNPKQAYDAVVDF